MIKCNLRMAFRRSGVRLPLAPPTAAASDHEGRRTVPLFRSGGAERGRVEAFSAGVLAIVIMPVLFFMPAPGTLPTTEEPEAPQ